MSQSTLEPKFADGVEINEVKPAIQKLLDGVIKFMPAPTDIEAIKGIDEDGNEIVRISSDDEPFSALAFKLMADPFVGKLAFFRVYSGTMNSGSYVLYRNTPVFKVSYLLPLCKHVLDECQERDTSEALTVVRE